MLDGTSSVSKDSYKFLMAPSVVDDAEMQEPDVASEKNKSDGSVKLIQNEDDIQVQSPIQDEASKAKRERQQQQEPVETAKQTQLEEVVEVPPEVEANDMFSGQNSARSQQKKPATTNVTPEQSEEDQEP